MSAQFVLRTAKLAQATRAANHSLSFANTATLARLSTLSTVASGSNTATSGRRFQSTSTSAGATSSTPQTTGTTDNVAVTEQNAEAGGVETATEELNASDVSGAPSKSIYRLKLHE